ncbi:glycoside hydrolase [Russula dissimulans]|nr:glycoside hydrolase [Russula dissimulans]
MSPLRAWPSAARVFLYRLPTRIIFCVILLFFLFSTLFRLAHAVHFLPEQYRPTVTPPSPASNRHRIKPQRPLADHRKGDVWARRADVVRSAFLDAYNSYVTYAAPHDELRPLSKTPSDNLNGWSLSYIDSLDTLWLMGLHEEFDDALAVVANITFSMPSQQYAPFFETVIRYLGGLLSAYALSKDPILLARADDLGAALLPVFGTHSGLPTYSVNTVSGKVKDSANGPMIPLSEMLSCQLEYKYLAYLTGRSSYYTTVEKVMEIVYDTNLSSSGHLLPVLWSTETGLPSSCMSALLSPEVAVGALADSAYEYMLKQWLLTGRTDTKARDLYLRSVNAILDHLTYITPIRKLLYVTGGHVSSNGHITLKHNFEHLTCFLPGLLALGAATLPDVPRTHMWAARGLAETCWVLYGESPTGLSPDDVVMILKFGSGGSGTWPAIWAWAKQLKRWEQSGAHGDPPGVGPAKLITDESAFAREYNPSAPGYYLRPETVESFYLLWRTTGDVVWRERGWKVCEALLKETHVETGGGFAALYDARHANGRKLDMMPSWFLAETLKYLFLLFTDDDLVPLDQWVFNTEAHPLPVWHWSEWEMKRLGISHNIDTA